jgi:hypothetical protein
MPTDSKPKGTKRGRPVSLNARWLRQRRDGLKGIFESYWPLVGWDLCRATTPEAVMQALRPLENLLKEPRINLLLTDQSGVKGLEDVRRYQVQRQRLSDGLQIVSKRLDLERQLFLKRRISASKYATGLPRRPIKTTGLITERGKRPQG